MFKKFDGKPDPVIDFGRKWMNRSAYGSLAISMLIVLSFTQETIYANPFFSTTFRFVAGIVPSVGRLSSVSHFPAYAGAIFSLNWFLVPFYFVLTVLSYNFFNDELHAGISKRFAESKSYMRPFLIPIGIGYFLMDWGVLPGVGIFTMSAYKIMFTMGIPLAMDTYPVTLAAFLWLMCWFEGMIYGIAFCRIAVRIRRWINTMHHVERHP